MVEASHNVAGPNRPRRVTDRVEPIELAEERFDRLRSKLYAIRARTTATLAHELDRDPAPLGRCVMTINSPSSPGTLVDIEFMVFDESAEGMASQPRTAELERYGWRKFEYLSFLVAFRVLGY
jgi:hypothetical protein